MKKLSFLVSLVLAFAISVWAQTPSTNDTQRGTGSSASQSNPSSSGSMGSQGSMSSPSTGSQTSGSMGQGNTSTAEQGKTAKEHKLKGCLESEAGSYMLREKNGKEVALTGSADLSQYANHEVAVHGDWASGAASSTSTTSDMSKGGGSEKQFTVDKVDSLSDTCKGASKTDKKTGTTTNPSGPQ